MKPLFLMQTLLSLVLLSPGELPREVLDTKINTPGYERDMAISPDGKEVFYTSQDSTGRKQTIMHLYKKPDGSWTQPVPAAFSGQHRDLEPFFSPDGKQLFFASDRPKPNRDGKDVDIWVMQKKGKSWSAPTNLGPAINSEGDEYYPSVTRDGHLYFTAERKDGVGKEDIYRAEFKNGQYLPAQVLDTGVNSTTYEFNAFVAPDESFLIFSSYGRADDKGRGDLYLSKRRPDGSWEKAYNLESINSDQLDYCPFVSPDGKTLYFTSERLGRKNGNIFMLPFGN